MTQATRPLFEFEFPHTCRFCKEYIESDDEVRYAHRHYAHHACYLKAGKRLEDLPDWEIIRFPYRLIKGTPHEAIGFAADERERTRVQERIAKLNEDRRR